MSERRYNDEEVAAIFRRAAEEPQAPPVRIPREEGLTLRELQEIGREVGIPPEAVAQAAGTVEPRGRAGIRTLFGLPSGVERTIELDRRLTEEEWEHLVVALRETFQARGVLTSSGSFRQWTNGNLQALLEPTPAGHRLRLKTSHGIARAYMTTGVAFLGVTAAVAIASAAGSQLGEALPGVTLMLVLGLGMFGSGALRLPAWARLRRKQMEDIAAGLALPAGPRPRELPDGSGD